MNQCGGYLWSADWSGIVEINQDHIIHTETMGEHRVKCVPFAVAGMLQILRQTKSLINPEANEEEERQKSEY